ncbi:MAG: LON peptidase substrate-binding domain-containing protein [Rhodothermales bacterium]|nr:LON peptidase substrate-binding domain-containing protein [Rhodothermales bacterium]
MTRLDRLPLFPLGLVLYPRERLPLHIFEERYKDLIGGCLRTKQPFGLVFSDEGKLARVGCTALVTDVMETYPDGRMDVLVRGQQRFKVLRVYNDLAYLTADVTVIEEPEEALNRDKQERVITQHMRLLELAGRTVRPSLYQNEVGLSYVIAPNAGLSSEQKQEVLELPTENERIDYLIGHLESLIPQVEKMEDLRRRIQSNGHFRDFPPEGEEE